MKRLLSVTPLPSQNGGLDGEMYMKSVVSSEFPTYYRSTGTKERHSSNENLVNEKRMWSL